MEAVTTAALVAADAAAPAAATAGLTDAGDGDVDDASEEEADDAEAEAAADWPLPFAVDALRPLLLSLLAVVAAAARAGVGVAAGAAEVPGRAGDPRGAGRFVCCFDLEPERSASPSVAAAAAAATAGAARLVGASASSSSSGSGVSEGCALPVSSRRRFALGGAATPGAPAPLPPSATPALRLMLRRKPSGATSAAAAVGAIGVTDDEDPLEACDDASDDAGEWERERASCSAAATGASTTGSASPLPPAAACGLCSGHKRSSSPAGAGTPDDICNRDRFVPLTAVWSSMLAVPALAATGARAARDAVSEGLATVEPVIAALAVTAAAVAAIIASVVGDTTAAETSVALTTVGGC